MRKRRVPVTMGTELLFLTTGLFSWRHAMGRLFGELSPARAVYGIGVCLREPVHVTDAMLEEPSATRASIEDLLSRNGDQILGASLPPDLESWGPQDAEWWRPREHLGDLIAVEHGPVMLMNARRRMSESGIRVDYGELSDLAAVFANDYLPRAMRGFDPIRGEGREAAWVTTVFCRYATPRVLSMWSRQVAFDEVFGHQEAEPIDEREEQLGRKAALELLLETLDDLPAIPREALSMYFGLSGREHTLQEVARHFGKSVHFARMAITAALASLVARLAPEKWGDPLDAEVARLLFAESHSVASISSKLGLGRREISRRATRIGNLVRTSLRARTVRLRDKMVFDREQSVNRLRPSNLEARHLTTEQPAALHGYQPSFEVSDPIAAPARHQLRRTIPDDSHAQVHVAGESNVDLSLEELEAAIREEHERSMAAGRPGGLSPTLSGLRRDLKADVDRYNALAGHLIQKGDEELLAFFFASELADFESPAKRSDLSHDQQHWDAIVESSLAGLEALADGVARGFSRISPATDLDVAELTQALSLALPMVATALEELLDWDSRAAGTADLHVWLADDHRDVHFQWRTSDNSMSATASLGSIVRDALQWSSQLAPQYIEQLGDHVCMNVVSRTVPLPGFTFGREDRQGHLVLHWHGTHLQDALL